MSHTVKGFGIANKAEVDVFLEFSSFFDDPSDVDNLISGSSAFSKSSLNIWIWFRSYMNGLVLIQLKNKTKQNKIHTKMARGPK